MTRQLTLINLAFKLAAIGLCPWIRWWAIAVFVFPDIWLLWGLLHPSSQLLVPSCGRFEASHPGAKELWLTIDDGPDPSDTPRLLEVLDRHGARATFFLIGRNAQRHPELVAAILARGHAVANHSYSHRIGTFWMASPGQVDREIAAASAVLRQAGATPHFFRPPVGIKNLALDASLQRHGLICVGWTIRSGDCFATHADRVVRRVVDRLAPGAILLVHEGPSVRQPLRVKLIDDLLAAISACGYRCIIPEPEQVRAPGAKRL